MAKQRKSNQDSLANKITLGYQIKITCKEFDILITFQKHNFVYEIYPMKKWIFLPSESLRILKQHLFNLIN